MAFIGDMKNFKLQLKLMNYAEDLDRKPRHHVRRISFIVTILEDDGDTTDEILPDGALPLSAEDKEVLKWQPRTTESWQNDFEVRDTLTTLSGRLCQGLCPCSNLGFSLFDKVTDDDTYHERIMEQQSLPSYRQVSFRSVMLTKHSVVPNEQVQLLFSCDGLPEDRSCLRWRSHDYIKLVLAEAKPSYRALWLVQWDVVDMTGDFKDGFDSAGRDYSRPCSTSKRHRGSYPGKFWGVRYRKERKSPWSAEVRPKGARSKISVGCYQTRTAAARAADAGRYHYNLNLDKLNFPDSLRFLDKLPPNLSEKAHRDFVRKQARQLVKLAETTVISETRSGCNTSYTGEFISRNICRSNYFGDHIRPAQTNYVSLSGLPVARPDGFVTPSDSGRDLQTHLVDVRSSTSFVGSGSLGEAVALETGEEFCNPELEPTYTQEVSLVPLLWNSSSGEATIASFFNVLDTAGDGNPEHDNRVDSAQMRETVSDVVEVSDSNRLGFHPEIGGSQSTNWTSPGYGLNQLVPGSEQTESNGDYGTRDMCFLEWNGFF